mgnify:CR=1 FL=1
MIVFAKVKQRIRTCLITRCSIQNGQIAAEGSITAPADGIRLRETFSGFSVDHPAQFSCRLSGSVIYEVLQPADREFAEAEALRQRIADLFQPPLLLADDEFRIQTTRITPMAAAHERSWNILPVRIHFFVFPD